MIRKVEIYYSKKSKTVYIMMPSGKAYFITKKGEVGETVGFRNMKVPSLSRSTLEDAEFACEMTPGTIRKLARAHVK